MLGMFRCNKITWLCHRFLPSFLYFAIFSKDNRDNVLNHREGILGLKYWVLIPRRRKTCWVAHESGKRSGISRDQLEEEPAEELCSFFLFLCFKSLSDIVRAIFPCQSCLCTWLLLFLEENVVGVGAVERISVDRTDQRRWDVRWWGICSWGVIGRGVGRSVCHWWTVVIAVVWCWPSVSGICAGVCRVGYDWGREMCGCQDGSRGSNNWGRCNNGGHGFCCGRSSLSGSNLGRLDNVWKIWDTIPSNSPGGDSGILYLSRLDSLLDMRLLGRRSSEDHSQEGSGKNLKIAVMKLIIDDHKGTTLTLTILIILRIEQWWPDVCSLLGLLWNLLDPFLIRVFYPRLLSSGFSCLLKSESGGSGYLMKVKVTFSQWFKRRITT